MLPEGRSVELQNCQAKISNPSAIKEDFVKKMFIIYIYIHINNINTIIIFSDFPIRIGCFFGGHV